MTVNAETHTGGHTWKSLPAAQQPDWPDQAALREVIAELESYPPLVFAGECDQLRERLGAVARGEAFLLQGGDCAEAFDAVGADQIRNKLKTLLQMGAVLTYAGQVPVVNARTRFSVAADRLYIFSRRCGSGIRASGVKSAPLTASPR